jgi:hypothetical protein
MKLTEQQTAFIEVYSDTIGECPKGLLIKYFEDPHKFGRTYREYYSSVEDCYSIWLSAIEWASKAKPAPSFAQMMQTPINANYSFKGKD